MSKPVKIVLIVAVIIAVAYFGYKAYQKKKLAKPASTTPAMQGGAPPAPSMPS